MVPICDNACLLHVFQTSPTLRPHPNAERPVPQCPPERPPSHRVVVEDGIFGLAPVDAGPEPARFAGCFM